MVLDAQGLAKLASGDPAVRALVRSARARDGEIVTAASTLAEVLRGGPKDAPVHQALKHVTVVTIDATLGRKAGELLGATSTPDRAAPDHAAPDRTEAGHADTADALLAVVALARQPPVVLLTSDPGDMMRLTEEPDRTKAERVAIIPI